MKEAEEALARGLRAAFDRGVEHERARILKEAKERLAGYEQETTFLELKGFVRWLEEQK